MSPNLAAKYFDPFAPGEETLPAQLDSASKGLRHPGLSEGGAMPLGKQLFQRGQFICLVDHLSVRRFDVGFPQVDVDSVIRSGFGAPELARFASHAVDMRWLVAQSVCAGISEGEAAVVTLDPSMLATDVARQASMGGRVDVARHNLIAGLEARRRFHLCASRRAALDCDLDHILWERRHYFSPFLLSSAMRCSSSA